MSLRIAPRSGFPLLIAWGILLAVGFTNSAFVAAQDASGGNTAAANQQFAVAAGFHNRQAWDLAADEWTKFIADFPQDERANLSRHYLGVCQLQLKKFGDAAATFAKLIEADPNFEQVAVSKLYLGMAQFNAAQAGDDKLFAAAEKTLAAALKAHPEGKQLPQTIFYLAESLYAQEKLAEAEPLYKRFVEEFPDDALAPDALYAHGVVLEDLKKGDAAQQVYAEFVRRYPEHGLRTEVDVRRADLMAAAGDFAGAERLFGAAAAMRGYEDADYALLRQAGCLYDQKQFAAAAELYEELPKRFPRSEYRAEAQLAAGRNHYFAGNWEATLAQLEPLIGEQGGQAAEAAHWSARALLKLQRPADAEKLLSGLSKDVAASKKFGAQLALDRADAIYDQPERRADALKSYKQLAETFAGDPLAAQATYLAALTALELGKNDEARKSADAYLKLKSDGSLRPDVLYIKAEAALRGGDHKTAVAAYDELLKSATEHADRPKWIVRRAYALSASGLHQEVIDSLENAAEELEDVQLASEARQLLGVSRQARKDYKGAVADLEAALKLAPNRPGADEILLALSEAQRLAGDVKSSQASLERLAADYPESKLLDTAFYRRGEAAYSAGDFDAAAAAYRRVVDDYPKSPLAPYARYGLAWTALGKNDAAAAASEIDALLKGKAPAELEAKARYARALAREQLGQFAPAIEDLQSFLKSKPGRGERSEALYWLGRCQMGLSKNYEALVTFNELLKSDADYAGAAKVLYEIGWLHKKAGRGKESAAAFARLAKEHASSPQAPEALFHVGEEAYSRKDYKAAIDAFYDARDKAASDELAEKAAYNLGLTYFHMENYAKAEEWFRFQLDKYEGGSLAQDAQFREAEAQFKQRKYKEAVVGFRKVKNPTEKEFVALAQLRVGQCLAQLEDWQGAQAALSAAVGQFATSPYLPEMNYELAWATQNLGREEEAIKLYELVTEQTQDVVAARARFMIGELYFQQKNHAEAVRHFFRAAVGYNYPEWQARSHFEAGRCFEVLGKLDQAKKSYEEVVNNFGKSEEAALAKKRLEELGRVN